MDLKAMFWPVAPLLGGFIGARIGSALGLSGLVAAGLILLCAVGGFMAIIFTHPGRR